MLKKTFNLTIYADSNEIHIIKITTIFLRRRINIESFNVASSEVDGIIRFTIVINETEEITKKLSMQINKQVGIFKTFYYLNEEIISLEHVLYKVSSTMEVMEKVLVDTGIRCIYTTENYTVLETTFSSENKAITKALMRFGIIEVCNSGRIAVTDKNFEIHQLLKNLIAPKST